MLDLRIFVLTSPTPLPCDKRQHGCMRLVAALGSRPVTLDTLPLLEDTAEHDTDGEE